MKHLTVFALALMAASSIHAGDVRLGFQATVAQPSGDVGNQDWMDSKLGFGVGLHALIDLGGGAALVPRLDYTAYSNDRRVNALVQEDAKVRILSGGADFHFYLSGRASEGIYLLGGLGYARGQFNSTYSNSLVSMDAEGTKGAIYLQGGVGVNFTPHVGIECRYQSLKFTDVETTFLGYTAQQDVSCPSIQASLVLRF